MYNWREVDDGINNAMLEWGRLIQKERDLITGVKKADRKRFKEKFKEYEDNSIPTN